MTSLFFMLLWLEPNEQLIKDMNNPCYRVREQAMEKLDLRLGMMDGFDESLYELLKESRDNESVEIDHRVHWLVWKYKERFFRSSSYIKLTFDYTPNISSSKLEEIKCEEIGIMMYYNYTLEKRIWTVILKRKNEFDKNCYQNMMTTIPYLIAVDVLPDNELNLWRY